MKGVAGGLAIVAFALAPLVGCDARSLSENATGSAGAGSGGTTGSGGTAGTSAGLPVTCPATCEQPAGPVYAFATVGEIYATLPGAWQFCARDGLSYPGPADVIGVEYGPASAEPTANGSTVGGNMYYLVAGPNGPIRGTGFDYQLTYDLSGTGPWQLNMHPTPNSGFGASVRYSPCPQELQITSLSVTGEALLVPF